MPPEQRRAVAEYPAHTEPSTRTWADATGDPQLTMAGLGRDTLAVGHSTATTAAVIQQGGTILTDRPNSPSLAVLRD
ncbi:hypothetical protein [Streptomyces platensis]|uniref:hypothetical protein n=1 Tax=Streptomyces platensis TaxID=58346 RepID=UPI002E12D3E5|nr:hypothetical protein OG229_05365 [Streptomyces platensis]WUB78560.1 hypothetical protein OG424_04830 [Streptomyces platensis]